jgi:hypothetical protein
MAIENMHNIGFQLLDNLIDPSRDLPRQEQPTDPGVLTPLRNSYAYD